MDPPPIFADEIRARKGSYITSAHAIGLAPGKEEIKPRRGGIFRDIEKHFRDPVLEKRLGGRRARPIAERERKGGKTHVDISFLLTSTVTLVHVILFPPMNT